MPKYNVEVRLVYVGIVTVEAKDENDARCIPRIIDKPQIPGWKYDGNYKSEGWAVTLQDGDDA